MGSGITVSCGACNYEKGFHLGIGMMYSSLENVIHHIDSRRRAAVLEILQNHKVEECDYEHKLYACAKCAGLYERFYAKIAYDGGEVYETKFICGKCRSGLVEIEDLRGVENRPCPRCNQKTLRVMQTLLWD